MDANNGLDRLDLSPQGTASKPVVKGTQLSVQYIMGLLRCGATAEEILRDNAGLTGEDIRACIQFAGNASQSREPNQRREMRL